MKNRKSLLSLAIVVLVLVLGVGYAAVNAVDLTISGTASAKTDDLNVHFVGGEVATVGATNGKVTATETTGKTATITVTDLTFNETVSATYNIINEEGDLAAKLSEKEIKVVATQAGEDGTKKDLTDYFQVTLELGDKAAALPAGETTTAKVTVKLVKTPTAAIDSSADITVTILAEAVQQ